MITEVKTLDAPELTLFARLTEAQLRSRLEPEKGIFIAESPKVIGTALENGYEPVAFLMERRHITGDAAPLLARCGEVPVYTGESALLEALTGFRLSRGVLCAMRRRPLPPLEAVLDGASRVAVLEGVVDATNIGAIFRSAAALGVDAVLVSPTCCDPLNRRAVRVSMGTVFQVPWTQLATDESGLALLKRYGFATAAMALSDCSVPLDDVRLAEEERLAIVLGAEGDGLRPATIAHSDYTVRIPMQHGVDSLNVAAASAVAFWELRKRTTSNQEVIRV